MSFLGQPTSVDSPSRDVEVTISVAPRRLAAGDPIGFVIENFGDRQVSFGDEHSIACRVGERWVELSPAELLVEADERQTAPPQRFLVEPGERSEWFELTERDWEPGVYRLVKLGQAGAEEVELSGEFEVEAPPARLTNGQRGLVAAAVVLTGVVMFATLSTIAPFPLWLLPAPIVGIVLRLVILRADDESEPG